MEAPPGPDAPPGAPDVLGWRCVVGTGDPGRYDHEVALLYNDALGVALELWVGSDASTFVYRSAAGSFHTVWRKGATAPAESWVADGLYAGRAGLVNELVPGGEFKCGYWTVAHDAAAGEIKVLHTLERKVLTLTSDSARHSCAGVLAGDVGVRHLVGTVVAAAVARASDAAVAIARGGAGVLTGAQASPAAPDCVQDEQDEVLVGTPGAQPQSDMEAPAGPDAPRAAPDVLGWRCVVGMGDPGLYDYEVALLYNDGMGIAVELWVESDASSFTYRSATGSFHSVWRTGATEPRESWVANSLYAGRVSQVNELVPGGDFQRGHWIFQHDAAARDIKVLHTLDDEVLTLTDDCARHNCAGVLAGDVGVAAAVAAPVEQGPTSAEEVLGWRCVRGQGDPGKYDHEVALLYSDALGVAVELWVASDGSYVTYREPEGAFHGVWRSGATKPAEAWVANDLYASRAGLVSELVPGGKFECGYWEFEHDAARGELCVSHMLDGQVLSMSESGIRHTSAGVLVGTPGAAAAAVEPAEQGPTPETDPASVAAAAEQASPSAPETSTMSGMELEGSKQDAGAGVLVETPGADPHIDIEAPAGPDASPAALDALGWRCVVGMGDPGLYDYEVALLYNDTLGIAVELWVGSDASSFTYRSPTGSFHSVWRSGATAPRESWVANTLYAGRAGLVNELVPGGDFQCGYWTFKHDAEAKDIKVLHTLDRKVLTLTDDCARHSCAGVLTGDVGPG